VSAAIVEDNVVVALYFWFLLYLAKEGEEDLVDGLLVRACGGGNDGGVYTIGFRSVREVRILLRCHFWYCRLLWRPICQLCSYKGSILNG